MHHNTRAPRTGGQTLVGVPTDAQGEGAGGGGAAARALLDANDIELAQRILTNLQHEWLTVKAHSDEAWRAFLSVANVSPLGPGWDQKMDALLRYRQMAEWEQHFCESYNEAAQVALRLTRARQQQ